MKIFLAIFSFLSALCFFTPAAGQQVYFIEKLDSDSGLLTLTRIYPEVDGYLVSGGYRNMYSNVGNVYIAKVDFNGQKMWEKRIEEHGKNLNNGSNKLIRTNDGNFAVAGVTRDEQRKASAYLFKLDVRGDTLWTKYYGSEGYNWFGTQCRQTSDSGFVIAGMLADSAIPHKPDFLLIKTDKEGNLQWHKVWGGTEYDLSFGLIILKNGDYLIAGMTRSFGGKTKGYLARLDSIGNIKWQRTLGGNYNDGVFPAVTELEEGGFMVGMPITENMDHVGNEFRRMTFFRLNENGSILWSKAYGEVRWENQIHKIIQLKDGNIAATGIYTDELGYASGVIIKTTPAGDSLFFKTYEITSINYLRDIKETESGGLVACGFAHIYPVTEKQTGWILSVDSLGCLIPGCDKKDDDDDIVIPSVESLSEDDQVRIFPNPAGETISIQAPGVSNISVSDQTGRLLISASFNDQKDAELNVSALSTGVYFVKITTQNQTFIRRLIKK